MKHLLQDDNDDDSIYYEKIVFDLFIISCAILDLIVLFFFLT